MSVLLKGCLAAGDAEPGPHRPQPTTRDRLRRGEDDGVAQRQALLPPVD